MIGKRTVFDPCVIGFEFDREWHSLSTADDFGIRKFGEKFQVLFIDFHVPVYEREDESCDCWW